MGPSHTVLKQIRFSDHCELSVAPSTWQAPNQEWLLCDHDDHDGGDDGIVAMENIVFWRALCLETLNIWKCFPLLE